MEDEREILIEKKKKSSLLDQENQEGIELKSFKSFLAWVCLDQTNIWKSTLSGSMFIVLVVGLPLVSHFVYACSTCDSKHRRPYDAIVQSSLSLLSTLSFFSLSSFAHKYGLRKFLFLDKLNDSSDKVRQGYTIQLQRSWKLLSAFVLPIFLLDSSYKIWWFISGGKNTPYFINVYASDIIACTLQLCSWLYRTSIFFFVCVLFRLICYLQILRLEDFAQVFEKESDVGTILREHLSIRRSLRIISHRFRVFILGTLVFVTGSQLASLLVTTESGSTVDAYTAGELAFHILRTTSLELQCLDLCWTGHHFIPCLLFSCLSLFGCLTRQLGFHKLYIHIQKYKNVHRGNISGKFIVYREHIDFGVK